MAPSAESGKVKGPGVRYYQGYPKDEQFRTPLDHYIKLWEMMWSIPECHQGALASKQSSSTVIIKIIRGPATARGQAQCWCIRHTFWNKGLNQSFAHPNKTEKISRMQSSNKDLRKITTWVSRRDPPTTEGNPSWELGTRFSKDTHLRNHAWPLQILSIV